MKTHSQEILDADSNSKRSCLWGIVPAVSILCVVLIFSSSFFTQRFNEKLLRWRMNTSTLENDTCKNQCRPGGSSALPEGIISNTSDLEMRPLWSISMTKTIEKEQNLSTNLFAMAVGITQKDLVNKMVKKFLASNFVVMLFHYDGIVDEWNEFEWSNHVIHVAVANQSKWWFAKRFLHPDIVAEYGYIFLWDEDLGVEHFHPDKYVSIIKSEGLEISQPALDTEKSEVHHQITSRGRRSNVHRRIYKTGGRGKSCDENSSGPPCTGWVEMMAPVFSRAAWRCVWYMIQNDLIHAWGLDIQLGYCAQGDRTKNVGVVDAEYIIHYGHPTLGGLDLHKVSSGAKDHRVDVRRQSYNELQVFRKRWQKAVEEDKCWVDPFQ
ncbi:hypothetical protein PHAVU_008G055100 [Phaseolus vulgaris]|uniref:Lysine ketoglutarate reductase trans-splicing-like protein n=2 Tax=Phaseolus vulgaris TaxID=3885 RepID=V7B5K1_PHAVU|nr:hypothetical protein PHAVU_008G055100g [Phaseolus vulgaris]ESW11731.1 hypothetical protein PHAVU_008G055100g [Phaseolus vulgaris]